MRPRLCLANPALLHSIQFFTPTTSILPLRLAESQIPPSDMTEDYIYPLVGCVESTDHKVHADIVLREFERAILSVDILGPSSSKKADNIMHQILRYKVIESLAWALSSIDAVPIQQPPPFAVDTSEHEHWDLGISDWESTVDSFRDAFRGDVYVPEPGSALADDKVLASLVSKIQTSESTRYHTTVISNMCGAALGLRGLFLVCVSSVSDTKRI